MPETLVNEFTKAKTPEDRRQVGIEWAIMQSRELKEFGVPCLHYYTMGDSETIQAIMEKVFKTDVASNFKNKTSKIC